MAKIQGADIKNSTEIVAAGATIASLPTDDQIYVSGKSINKTLKQSIIDGNIGGSLLSVATKTANYTLASSDDLILSNTASGAITLTLPDATTMTGKILSIKQLSGANKTTINTTSSQTIDSVTSRKMGTYGDFLRVVSDGANWKVMSDLVSVRASARCSGAPSLSSASPTNFDSVLQDPIGDVTTGASWKYTCSTPGTYILSVSLSIDGFTGKFAAFINGSKVREIAQVYSGTGVLGAGSVIIELSYTDFLDIRLVSGSGGGNNNPSANWFTIQRIGVY